jgi:hypothetical protein
MSMCVKNTSAFISLHRKKINNKYNKKNSNKKLMRVSVSECVKNKLTFLSLHPHKINNKYNKKNSNKKLMQVSLS